MIAGDGETMAIDPKQLSPEALAAIGGAGRQLLGAITGQQTVERHEGPSQVRDSGEVAKRFAEAQSTQNTRGG